jgi:hypothetical protein
VTVYTFTETLTTSALNAIANSVSTQFGVLATPSATIDGQSFIYTKNEENRSFSLSKTKDIVSVSYQRIFVDDETMILKENTQSAALLFFSPLFSLPAGMSLYSIPSGNIPLEGVVIVERPLPTLTSHVFGIVVNNIPLLTKEYTSRWASAILDDKGAVRILNYILAPNITAAGELSIVSIDEAVANLNAGRGAILWVTQATGSQYGATPSFKEAALTDVALVYVYQNNALVPAYQFEGNATTLSGVLQTFSALVLAAPIQQ